MEKAPTSTIRPEDKEGARSRRDHSLPGMVGPIRHKPQTSRKDCPFGCQLFISRLFAFHPASSQPNSPYPGGHHLALGRGVAASILSISVAIFACHTLLRAVNFWPHKTRGLSAHNDLWSSGDRHRTLHDSSDLTAKGKMSLTILIIPIWRPQGALSCAVLYT